MTNPTCETCRFSRESRERRFCAKEPPVIIGDESGYGAPFGLWPQVLDDDWCGEHQPREVAVKKPKVREEGWYWASPSENLAPEPCLFWPSFGWSTRAYVSRWLKDHEMAFIDERRIERDVSA